MKYLEELHQTLQTYIRPTSFPVAVKLQEDNELPEDIRRPSKVFGHPLTICQGIAIARRYGWTIGFLKEDHACGPSMPSFGLVEEPDFIKDGSIVYPLYTKTLEAGAKTQSAMPALKVGTANSIILSPLHKANFEPDVVLIYGNPAQVVRLIQGSLYNSGGVLESRSMGRAACTSEIVSTFVEQKCNVTIPGGGEKAFALTGDDEIVFSVPKKEIPNLIEGIVSTHKEGASRFPTPLFGLRSQPIFPEKYDKLQEYCDVK